MKLEHSVITLSSPLKWVIKYKKNTYKHSSNIVRELLSDDRKGSGEERRVAHSFYDTYSERQRHERDVPLHFV